MADTKISAETSATALDGTELLAGVQAGSNVKVTPTQIAALKDKLNPYYVAGNWVCLVWGVFGSVTTMTLNTIYLTPFRIEKAITLSDLAVRVRTGVAASNIQLAIYNSTGTSRKPGTLVGATGSIASATSSANVSGDISGADVTLQPGLYWAAINCDTSGIAVDCIGQGVSLMNNMIGSATLANIATSMALGQTIAQTYGTWPDLTGQSFTDASSRGPLVFGKVSAVP